MDHGLIRNKHNAHFKKKQRTPRRNVHLQPMLSPAKKDGVGMMLWHAGARLSVAVHLQENQMPPFHKALQQTEKACYYRDKHYEASAETQATQKQNPEHWCLLHSEQLARLFQDGRANDW